MKSRVEQYIQDYTRGCSNELDFKENDGSPMYEPWLTTDQARAVAEIAREEVIEEAIDYISKHIGFKQEYPCVNCLTPKVFIDDFRKALEKGGNND